VAGSGAVNEAEPVVESMVGGGGVVAAVNRHAEVPFAEVGGGVAVVPEQFRDGRFAAPADASGEGVR